MNIRNNECSYYTQSYQSLKFSRTERNLTENAHQMNEILTKNRTSALTKLTEQKKKENGH